MFLLAKIFKKISRSQHNSSCWVRIKENIIKKIEKFFLYFVKGIKQIKLNNSKRKKEKQVCLYN